MRFALPFLQQMLNTALRVDEESHLKLKRFNGRSIHIAVTDLQINLLVEFEQSQLYLREGQGKVADLMIEADSFALVSLAKNPNQLFSAEIKILGDVQFAKQIQDWLAGFDFDWEAQIASLTGDTLAYPISQGLRRSYAWLKQSQNSLEQNLAEYLREEAKLLPDQSEINEYLSVVDQIRADVDRLDARIKRLKSQQS